jgi:hypothetical protein
MSFTYEPLIQVDDVPSIRLLTLSPGTGDEALSATVSSMSLAAANLYEALSYHWGNPRLSKAIICNGQEHGITENLHQALWWLRHETQERRLWVDAICINQQDVEERNQQVSIMRSIYEKADCVIAWIEFDEKDHEYMGFDLVPRLIRAKYLVVEKGLSTEFQDANMFRFDDHLSMCELPPISSPEYLGLRGMLMKPWFERVWVIQEVVVSRKTVLCYKDKSIGWDDWVQALTFVGTTPLAAWATDRKSMGRACSMIPVWQAYKQGRRDTLLELMERFRNNKATDPRDKVFSLLGLASDSLKLNLAADYNLSEQEVFRDTAMATIVTYSRLDVLGFVDGIRAATSVPSWAPVWRDSEMRSIPFSMVRAVGCAKTAFDASKGSNTQPTFDDDGYVVWLAGFEVDCVNSLGLQLSESIMPELAISKVQESGQFERASLSSLLGIFKIYIGWEKFANVHAKTKYPTEEANLDAYIQLLTYNTRSGQDWKKSRDAYARFMKWYRRYDLATRLQIGNFRGFMYLALYLASLLEYFTSDVAQARLEFPTPVFLNLTIMRTAKGYLGFTPPGVKLGDRIYIAKGSRTPLILRPTETGPPSFRVIGDCFVHGIMAGEAYSEEKCKPIRVV